MVFDGDHDFEGPRAPKAHLDTVKRNLSHHLGKPFNPITLTQAAVAWKREEGMYRDDITAIVVSLKDLLPPILQSPVGRVSPLPKGRVSPLRGADVWA